MAKTAKYTLFLIFLICGFIAVAQPQVVHLIDSLKREWGSAKDDRKKAVIGMDLVSVYGEVSADSAMAYLRELDNIARRISSDSINMETEGLWALYFVDKFKADSALVHGDKAVSLAKKTGNTDRQLAFLFMECSFLDGYSDSLLLAKCTSGFDLARSAKDKAHEAKFLGKLATLSLRTNQISQALEYLNRCIKINDSMGNLNALARNYSMVMAAFGKQKNYTEAAKYGLRADSIYNKTGEQHYSYFNKINLAILYRSIKNYSRSIELCQICINNLKDDSESIMEVTNELGISLKLAGQLNKSVDALMTARGINSRLFHAKDFEQSNSKELAGAYLLLNKPDSALFYARQAEELAKGNELTSDGYNQYKELLELLYQVYLAKGDQVNAVAYHKKYVDFIDKVIAKMQEDDVAEADAKFHLSEKNRELKLLIDENELQRVRAQQQKILSAVLIIGLLLGIAVIVAVIIIYRRTVARNKVLSEQKRVIDEQVEQITAATKMRSRLLANISHELRTPATLLSGMIELVKDTHDPGKQKDTERLEMAYSNSLKLQQMIEEILDLSKLENKETEVKYVVREVSPLLKRMVYSFESLFKKEGIELVYNESLPKVTYLSIDEGKLSKIVNNLIYNAIKFNKTNGKVTFDVALSGDRKNVIIKVADTGVGISPNDLPHIFERFYQGATNDTAKAKGAGIGLALVKEFSQLMGGDIEVTSREGAGTTFTLWFPVADVASDSFSTADEAATASNDWSVFKTKQNVLVIEDNEEMRYYLREIFGSSVNIIEAGNGKDALNSLNSADIDLIITDLMMPVMDGREFVTQLKANDTYRNIPVIMLTALADTESRFSMLRLGIDDYIVKPFISNELVVRVYNLLFNNLQREEYNALPMEAEILPASTQEADEFREVLTQAVLAKIGNIELSVADIAKVMGYSEKRLYTLSKSLTGCTPAQLVKEVRLQKAYELLVTNQVFKLDDLAKRVGYEHLSYFSKQFYERFGKRPSEYMK